MASPGLDQGTLLLRRQLMGAWRGDGVGLCECPATRSFVTDYVLLNRNIFTSAHVVSQDDA